MQEPHAIPLAVVGMACRLPQADGLDAFWTLLVEGRSAVAEIPNDRLNRRLYFAPKKGVRGKSYTTIGCLVDYPPPDPAHCPLTQEQITLHDPAHVAMVEIASKACRHAGLDPFDMPRQQTTGVYVGHTRGSTLGGDLTVAHLVEHTAQYLREIADFPARTHSDAGQVADAIVHSVRARHPAREPGRLPNVSGFQAAGLVARALELDGPFMTVNAACASSLQALNIAARALQLGEIDMALVGGAAYLKVDSLVLFSHAQSVSATGSRPFDADADGLVNGEGYVALVIEPLERALAHGRCVHAVIRGIGMSCDGSGKSLWAPRKEGQILAMQRAYQDGVAMSSVQYIEAHATSTQVGDATELMALGEVLRERLPDGVKIPVGSVKANIGHTIEAAGLAGLLKTVLSLKNRTIPPAINVRTPNPKIDWARMPFYLPQTALPWPAQPEGQPRCAGVNSFGIGGLNVHVVVQEFVPGDKAPAHRIAPGADMPGIGASAAEPIAIIGMGAILPGALDAEAYWELLVTARDPKRNASPERWNTALAYAPGARMPFRTPTLLGGFITDFQYDWKTRKIPPKQIAHADPLQFMLLEAVDQALRTCGCDTRPGVRERTGVYVGALTAGEFHEQLQMGLRLPELEEELARVLAERGVPANEIQTIAHEFGALLLERMPALLDETGSYTTNTLASRITKTFNLMGGAAAIDAGTASAAAALSASVNALRAGDCDVVVCAAGQRSMGPAAYEVFSLEGKLSMADPRSPFDTAACGFVPGEGAAAVVLKRLSDARRDGDAILGVIRGIGAARSDDYEAAVREALRRAVHAAGTELGGISCIETAGQALPVLDRQEIAGLAAGLQGHEPAQPIALGAITSQLGHLGAGHAMAGLIKVILALRHGRFPGNVALEEPAAFLKGQSLLEASKDARPLSSVNGGSPAAAGVSAAADAQLAYHIVIEPGAAHPPAVQAGQAGDAGWRICRFEGADLPALVEALGRTAANAEAVYRTERSGFSRTGAARLAIVAESPQDLAQKSALASRQLLDPQSHPLLREKGIFCFPKSAERVRVAFLFAGQGSQYSGMLRSLVQEFAPAGEAVRRIDEVLRRLGHPSVANVLWEEGGELGKSVWRTQLSLLIADTVYYLCLAALRLVPDRIAGHSFGEFAALLAAGAWDFENAVRATRARCAAIEARPETRGVMMSVHAPAAAIEKHLKRLAGRAYVSCYNAPEQTVVGGSKSAVLALAECLARENVRTQVIDTPAPFHTPLMEAVQAPFGEALAGVALSPPTVPVLSNVHNRYVADPDDIRAALVAQLTSPVRYLDLVRRLAEEDTRIFVEVGPRQVLTRLNRSILEASEAVAISVDQPKKSGLQQLLCVQACLETAGAAEQDRLDTIARMLPGGRRAAGGGTAERLGIRQPARDLPPETSIAEAETEPERVCAPDPGPNLLSLSGTRYQMGVQHGRTHAREILALLRRYADMAGSWEPAGGAESVPAAARHPEAFFGADDLDELRGIADGAGVALAAVIAHNARLHDHLGAGAHFAIAARDNRKAGLIHCANEDQALALRLGGCLVRNVQARFPAGGMPHLIFGSVGQAGGFSGINARGLTVTSAPLPRIARTGAQGTLLAAIVGRLLARAEGMEEAAEIIQSVTGAGAWALCVTYHPADDICYAEYDGDALKLERRRRRSSTGIGESLLLPERGRPSRASQHRLARLQLLLNDAFASSGGFAIPEAQAALRDCFDLARGRETRHPTTNTVRRADTQMSLVMEPARGRVWATAAAHGGTGSDRFFELDVHALLAAATEAPTTGHAEAPQGPSISSQAPDAAASKREEEPLCRRFVLRRTEAPLPQPQRSCFPSGPALILGDNALAQALQRSIEAAGGRASTVAPALELEDALARVEQAFGSGPVPHLFLLTPCDAEARTDVERARWQRRRALGATMPYFVCQRWYQLLLEKGGVDAASLVGITALGGDFGLEHGIGSAESGAITGLVKALKREVDAKGHRGFTAKVIDTAAHQPAAETVACVFRELEDPDEEIEVSWSGGRRALVQSEALRAEPCGAGPGIARGGVWVVTGGARGITAVVARELARRYDLHLQLLGSTPPPEVDRSWHGLSETGLKALRAEIMKQALARGEVPVAAWSRVMRDLEIDRNLSALTAAGVRFNYHCCDVTDYERMRAVLEDIRAGAGPIQGILHGAAFESAIRFESKRRELVERTIAVKVDGAAHLMDLTRADPIRHFLAFGSISGRFGGIGQTDYSLANDFLAKLVSWYGAMRPEARVATIHWHAWDDVGMAVRPEKSYIRQYSSIRYMPAREGIRHFLDELSAGLLEREVVVTDGTRYEDLLGPELARHEPLRGRARNGAKTGRTAPAAARLPLVDAIEGIDKAALTATLRLDPEKDPFLAQHLFKGRPLMPGAFSMAALAQAASLLLESGGVSVLRDVEFVAPLGFHTDRARTARLHASLEGDAVVCKLTADFLNRAGKLVEKDRVHARAVAGTAQGARPPCGPEPDKPSAWHAFRYPEAGLIYHGELLRGLEAVALDERGGWGRIVVPSMAELSGTRRGDQWIVPAPVIDAGFVICAVHARLKSRSRVFYVPKRLERLSLGRPCQAGEPLYVRFVARPNDDAPDGPAAYDFTIFDAHDEPVAEASGYAGFLVPAGKAAEDARRGTLPRALPENMEQET